MILTKALICDERQDFSIRDVQLDDPASDQVAIRTHWSGVSIGTEFALVRNKISWGPYPLCTGYMGTGIIETVGEEIDNFAVGDRVYFRRNDSMVLSGGNKVSCASGAHCAHAVLRANTSHGVDRVPEGVGMDAAAMFVMPAVGLHGVDMANPRMGQKVVVYGVGSIGLGGCRRLRSPGMRGDRRRCERAGPGSGTRIRRDCLPEQPGVRCCGRGEPDCARRRGRSVRSDGAAGVPRSGDCVMPAVRDVRMAG